MSHLANDKTDISKAIKIIEHIATSQSPKTLTFTKNPLPV